MRTYNVYVAGEIKERLNEVNNDTLRKLLRKYGKSMKLQSVICL